MPEDKKDGLNNTPDNKPVINQGIIPPAGNSPVIKNKRPIWLRGLLGVVIGAIVSLIILLIVFLVGIYSFNWQNQAAQAITRILPVPAAMLDWQFIRYSEYNSDLATLNYFPGFLLWHSFFLF